MTAAHDPQLYFHVRIVMGMILGLAVARLLNGLAKFIQHPGEYAVSPIHLGWAFNTLIGAFLFWWWEFRLGMLGNWTFLIYLFVLSYTSLFYFMCVLLFPDHLGEYSGYRAYFYAKRKWFFGILAVSQVMDVADTLLKGVDYARLVGWAQGIETLVLITGCIIAARTDNQRFHAAFLVLFFVTQILWMLSVYYRLT
ncbi:hypothetical protein ACLBXM_14750 [Xanthobacteraceae bacterium A53D]